MHIGHWGKVNGHANKAVMSRKEQQDNNEFASLIVKGHSRHHGPNL